jgi:XRE family transcriptional regulator, regulator of sulfur utilization
MRVSTPDDPSAFLANNIRALREARGATQQQMAILAGVPRPTWANLESGSANPTLAVLTRAASALGVSVEELIGPPRAAARLYPAESLPSKRRGQVRVRQLLPDTLAGVAFERLELPPGASMTGVPHTPGTREYLTCEAGEIELSASGERWRLARGDVLVFRGDQRHGYRNPGRTLAVGYSVIAFAAHGARRP